MISLGAVVIGPLIGAEKAKKNSVEIAAQNSGEHSILIPCSWCLL